MKKEKKIKPTIKGLEDKLRNAEALIEHRERLEVHRRQEFSSLLTHFFPRHDKWGLPEKAPLMSWEEIFFRIGELNSDANYSIILEQNDNLKRENAELHAKLNPPKKQD